MDLDRLVPWLAAVVVIAIAVVAYRALRARTRRAAIARAQAEAVSEDEAFLDSSHIAGPIQGLSDRARGGPK